MKTLANLEKNSAARGQQTDDTDRIVDGQERMISAIEALGSNEEGIDAESRMRLRSIDVQMLRILEEISAGRQEVMAELRKDLADLSRTIASARGTSEPRRFRHANKPEGEEG